MGGRGRRHSCAQRVTLLSLLNEAVTQGARLFRACECVGISQRSYQRWSKAHELTDQRKGPRTTPSHALSKDERKAVIDLVNQPEYRNLTPEQIVAKEAENGRYLASERTLRRILHDEKMDTYRGRAKPPKRRSPPRSFKAQGPMQVLSWDITYLPDAQVRGHFFYLYAFLDLWSRKVVGWDVHREQTSQLASSLLQRIAQDYELSPTCVLHSDNGAPMKGTSMLCTMQNLGILNSFSRPSVSNDNPFIESYFRHLKYVPSYPSDGFESLEHARSWVRSFVHWYNHEHLHSSLAYVTPEQRFQGHDKTILQKRRKTYEHASSRHPRRWTRGTRAWNRPDVVVLNPERVIQTQPRPTESTS